MRCTPQPQNHLSRLSLRRNKPKHRSQSLSGTNMAREITWSLHTETGNWNTSFNTARITDFLNYLGLYWDINFTRNNNGRIRYTLARSPNPNWVAWTKGFNCRINVAQDFNWAGANNRDMVCAKVACHEFGHMVRQGNIHSATPGLMDTSATMPTGNLVQTDYPWFDAYPRKAGSLRPHEEPNRMRRTFIPGFTGTGEPESIAMNFGCGHKATWLGLLGIGGKP